MVDLFRDIPEERIEMVLSNIRNNLEQVNLRDGHTIKRHVDVQLGVLQMRLTMSDIRYATSFYDFDVAKMAVQELLKQYFEEKIAGWLVSVYHDVLVLCADVGKEIGYGYRKQDNELYEGLSKIRLVLEKDASCDWGFRILTCFPIF